MDTKQTIVLNHNIALLLIMVGIASGSLLFFALCCAAAFLRIQANAPLYRELFDE